MTNKGKMALVNHYKNFLNNGNYNIDQEIYFRRLMWWAFNDFVRNRHQINIECYTSKEMSFKVWYRNRKKILEGIALFKKCHDYFKENLSTLIDLYKLRYTPDDEEYESVNLDIIEIYRQLGDFENARLLLGQTSRRTHFISMIEKKVEEKDLIKYVQPQDLKSFGLIPELIGRFPVLTHLDALDKAALKRILSEPKNSLIKQYVKLLEIDGVKLSFKEDALDYFVEIAEKHSLGARGLRGIVESVMTELMFELPGSKTKEFVITKKYAQSQIEKHKDKF